MVSMPATCDSRQAKLLCLIELTQETSPRHSKPGLSLLSPTLTDSHGPVLKGAQTFSSHPALSLHPQCPWDPSRETDQGQPSPHPSPTTSGCPHPRWEHLHLPRLLQHLQPLRLLKLRLCRQQDVPLPGRGATVHLRKGRSEDMEAAQASEGPALLSSAHILMALRHPHPRHWRGFPRGPGGPREAALPLRSPS